METTSAARSYDPICKQTLCVQYVKIDPSGHGKMSVAVRDSAWNARAMCVDPVYVRAMCTFHMRCARIFARRARVCMHLGTAMRGVSMRVLIYQHKIYILANTV